MNLSKVFIERPVATTILVAAIIIFGLIAFRALPVNELPSVDFPTINVTAELPGANPDVMATTGATPLEAQFRLHRDIDAAAQDFQTAISQAMRRLPEGMDPPTLRKFNPADAPILFLA